MMRRNISLRMATGLLGVVLLASLAVTGVSSASTKVAHAKVRMGGSATVTVTGWTTLDPSSPAISTSELSMLTAVYGSLFEESSTHAIIPGLALSYKYGHEATSLTIHLRHGVKFQDGTPFNAAAVKFNIIRDRTPADACVCGSWLQTITSISTPDKYTVILRMSSPNTSLIYAFVGAYPGFIVSPTAVAREGTNYGLSPVGAGPFKVVSNQPSDEAVMTKWSGYWDRPHPDLNQLTFLDQSIDTSSYESLVSGASQIATGVLTPTVIVQAKANSQLTADSVPERYQFVAPNATIAPFNNIIAREAIAYATNSASIAKYVLEGVAPVTEVLDTPAMVPYVGVHLTGFPKYDPAKAAQLVKELGGLTFTIITQNSSVNPAIAQALQQQWNAVGMHVSVSALPQASAIADHTSGNFQAILSSYGGVPTDLQALNLYLPCPAANIGNPCPDPVLTKDLAQVTAAKSFVTQKAGLEKVFKQFINKEVGEIPLFNVPEATIYSNSIKGLSALAAPYWDDVYES